jgi:hypothetical protein
MNCCLKLRICSTINELGNKNDVEDARCGHGLFIDDFTAIA